MSNTIIIDEEARYRYSIDAADVDVMLLFDNFQVPKGSKVLVVGAHDEPTANLIASLGLDVYGVDLREYDNRLPPCNYTYVRGDFCNLPASFVAEHMGTFDTVVALSCIEHFGMGAYSEGRAHPYYDVIAMRKVWEYLKLGGLAYVTVPFGGHYLEVWPNWRVYDLTSAISRLVQDFNILNLYSATAVRFQIDGRDRKIGEIMPQHEVARYSGIPPHISTLLVLQKQDTTRRAPDGR